MLKTGLVYFFPLDISEVFSCLLMLLFFSRALCENTDCLEDMSGMNLSISNNKLLIMLLIVMHLEQKISQ